MPWGDNTSPRCPDTQGASAERGAGCKTADGDKSRFCLLDVLRKKADCLATPVCGAAF